jgi:nicotinamide-nucleotide amidase
MMTRPAPNELASHAARVIEAAQKAGVTLAAAESCTAGALATLLANAPGAGEVFHGSFVVYTKENKVKALGVEAALISRHSAVSEEVAKAMALGALERSPADVAVAITGVAGPEPDEDGNPVGLVHIAAAQNNGAVLHEEHRFGDLPRAEICAKASGRALAMLEALLVQRDGRDELTEFTRLAFAQPARPLFHPHGDADRPPASEAS